MRDRIIIFIFSLLLLFLSAWNYSIFIRVGRNASEACRFSEGFVRTGKNMGIFFIAVSSIFVLFSAWGIYAATPGKKGKRLGR